MAMLGSAQSSQPDTPWVDMSALMLTLQHRGQPRCWASLLLLWAAGETWLYSSQKIMRPAGAGQCFLW